MRFDATVRTMVCVVALLVASAAFADSEVTATGKSVLKNDASVLRMTLLITADGKDVKEAIANLAKQREEAKAKLQSLGVDEKSVKFSDANVGDGTNAQQAQYRRMMMMQARARGGAKAATGPATVTVSTNLQAEWPIKGGGDKDELLVSSQQLQDKIKAAFTKSAKPMSAEEQEVMEEMQNSGGYDPSEGAPKPGEPAFAYVRVVSDEELSKATADAFAQAKAEATRLAKAVGGSLGAVSKVSANAVAGNDQSRNAMNYYYMQQFGQVMPGEPAEGSREAIGTTPAGVTFTVVVSATFQLK